MILVSALFPVVVLLVFFAALARGHDLPTARTLVVDMVVVAEIFYLFNVRYLHMRSMTARGALGTPALLLAIAAVVVAQFCFTYLPAMQRIFDNRAVDPIDGAILVAAGFAMFLALEAEKFAMRRLDWFEDLRA